MKMLTTGEVAERLGVTVQRIHQFIKDERLPAQKMGRDYLIDENDLKRIEDRPTGRPPKAQGESQKPATGRKRANGGASTGGKKGRK
jgi:excisionase family DNA binding protein